MRPQLIVGGDTIHAADYGTAIVLRVPRFRLHKTWRSGVRSVNIGSDGECARGEGW